MQQLRAIARALLLCALAFALVPGAAHAQTGADEADAIEEDRGGADEVEDIARYSIYATDDIETRRAADIEHGEFEWSLYSTADVISQNNQDFRRLDETSDNAIRFSDDRHTDTLTRIRVGFWYRPVTALELHVDLGADVIWGGDIEGDQSSDREDFFLSDFAIRELYVAYNHAFGDVADFQLRVGRQAFGLGGAPNDYIFNYNIDAITASLDLHRGGRIRGILFEVYGGADPSQSLAAVDFGSDREQFIGFRGKSNTFRSGLVYEFDASHWELGNFTDNDFVHVFGGRATYALELGSTGNLGAHFDFTRSQGIDRKEPQVFDVSTDGNGFGGGVTFDNDFGDTFSLRAGFEGYRFDGGTFSRNGLRFEHGYVGMRGERVGGLLAGYINGFRPYAYLAPFGVQNRPYRTFRSAGTAFVHGNVGAGIGDTDVDFDVYWYKDTSSTNVVDFPLGRTTDLPAGYQGDEIDAQRNLGRVLGTEFNVRVAHELVEDMFHIYAGFGIMLPGPFYENFVPPTVTTDDRVIGGGDDVGAGELPFWAVRVGARLAL